MTRRTKPHNEFEQAVASVTGEDLQVIRQRGFSLIEVVDEEDFDFEPEDYLPNYIDWDARLEVVSQ